MSCIWTPGGKGAQCTEPAKKALVAAWWSASLYIPGGSYGAVSLLGGGGCGLLPAQHIVVSRLQECLQTYDSGTSNFFSSLPHSQAPLGSGRSTCRGLSLCGCWLCPGHPAVAVVFTGSQKDLEQSCMPGELPPWLPNAATGRSAPRPTLSFKDKRHLPASDGHFSCTFWPSQFDFSHVILSNLMRTRFHLQTSLTRVRSVQRLCEQCAHRRHTSRGVLVAP